jgi:hypothetical protein
VIEDAIKQLNGLVSGCISCVRTSVVRKAGETVGAYLTNRGRHMRSHVSFYPSFLAVNVVH